MNSYGVPNHNLFKLSFSLHGNLGKISLFLSNIGNLFQNYVSNYKFNYVVK